MTRTRPPLDPDADTRSLVDSVAGAEPLTALPSIMWILHRSRSDEPEYVVLGDQPLVIGRMTGPGVLTLADPDLSRRHAALTRRDGIITIEDLCSRNGTFVDGVSISGRGPVPLFDGTRLRLGGTVLLFREPGCPEGGDSTELPGRTPDLATVRRAVRQLGPLDTTVLVLGETGTGKEYVARAIHAASGRSSKRFVAVNCSELAPELLRSELFGARRGAFTGAVENEGLIAESEGGTLFLDEVGELHRNAQAELLRFLQDRSCRAVGSSQTRTANVRIVAATNVDLDLAAREGRFRLDLLARLRQHGGTIRLPPLRERIEDIPLWLERFAGDIREKTGQSPRWSAGFVECLCLYHWPANLRELSAALWTATLAAGPDEVLEATRLPDHIVRPRHEARGSRGASRRVTGDLSLHEVVAALRAHDGNMKQTATALGVDRRALYRLAEKFGLVISDYR